MVKTDLYPIINKASKIEEILCLASLIAREAVRPDATIERAILFYDDLEDGCSDCPYKNICLACIINE